MESKLIPLLTPLFPNLDGPLIDYLAGIAVENGAKKWSKASEAFDCLGELLESYEAVANEKEAKEKCQLLFTQMQEAGIIAAPASSKPAAKPLAASSSSTSTSTPVPASNSASAAAATVASVAPVKPVAATSVTLSTPAAAPVIQPGYYCQARYGGDGLFYSAQVLSVKTIPVVRVRVRFLEYGDEEEMPASGIKDLKPGVLPEPTVGKKAERREGDEEDNEDDEDDESDEEDEEEDVVTSGGARKLLSNPVRIGELGPSLAALRLSEREKAQEEAERNMTPKERKMLLKRQLKAERAAKELEASRTWNPDSDRTALQHDALPIYLQSQHLAKKAGTKDIAVDSLSLLAPDNTELLSNTELRLVHGRRYGIIGRNGIGQKQHRDIAKLASVCNLNPVY